MPQQSSQRTRGESSLIFPLCALGTLPLLFLFKVCTQGDMLFGSDTVAYFAPVRALGFEQMRHGDLLEWNPYMMAGLPYLGEVQTALFYPLNWLHLVLPLGLAITLTTLLHLWLSGILMYLWGRWLDISRTGAIVSGLIYQLSGFQFARLYGGHLPFTAAYAWLPLMFLLAQQTIQRRSWLCSVGLGATMSLQILAGAPQLVLWSDFGLGIWWLTFSIRESLALAGRMEQRAKPNAISLAIPERVRQCARSLVWSTILGACAVAVALALSAVQILPTLDTIASSVRAGGISYEFASSFSMPPENFITLLFPDFLGDTVHVPYWGRWLRWEVIGYIGIVPMLLAVIAILVRPTFAVRVLAGLAGFGLLLALGRYLVIHQWLYRFVPGMAFFRDPGRALLLWTLAGSALAGIGWDCVQFCERSEGKRLRLIAYCFSAFAGIGIVALICFLMTSSASGWWKELTGYVVHLGRPEERFAQIEPGQSAFLDASFRISRHSLFWGVLWMSSAVVWLWARHSRANVRQGWALAGVLLVSADLSVYGFKYVQGTPLSRVHLAPEVRQFLSDCRNREGTFRVANATQQDYDTVGMMERIEMVGGYEPFVPARFAEYTNFNEGRPLDSTAVVARPIRHTTLLDLLNARYVLTEQTSPPKDPSLVEVFHQRQIHIYENLRALPRVWIVHEARVISDRIKLLQLLAGTGVDPNRTMLLESPAPHRAGQLPAQAEQLTMPSADSHDKERCEITAHTPERVEVECQLTSDGYLVLSDSYSNGWQVRVDGQQADILRANYLLRAVSVPSGVHTVTFVYDAPGLRQGAMISLPAWLAVGVGTLLLTRHASRRVPRRKSDAITGAQAKGRRSTRQR